jgi:hypothetical protein
MNDKFLHSKPLLKTLCCSALSGGHEEKYFLACKEVEAVLLLLFHSIQKKTKM